MLFPMKNETLVGNCQHIFWRDLEAQSLEVKVKVTRHMPLSVTLPWAASMGGPAHLQV